MEQIHDYEDVCARYLLGELSEQEQAQLEESYFTDDALFERFLAVKDDLIDAYARGDLAGEKRERFEQHFLASRPRQQRVEEAKGFIRAVTAASTNAATVSADGFAQSSHTWCRQFISSVFSLRPMVLRGALAALLLVALGGSWVLVRRFQGQRAERERVQNEEAARRQPEEERGQAIVPLTNPTATPAPDRALQPKPAEERAPQPLPSKVASLFLMPFSPRDATASNSLHIRPDTSAVRLRLAFAGADYRRYDVILRRLDGKQVFSRRGLGATSGTTGKNVTITLAPSIFLHQDYIITLSGLTADGKLEVLGDYNFRVERNAPQSTPTPNR